MATVLRSRGSSMASLFLRAPATGVVIQPPPSTTCVVHASTISTLVQGSSATGGLLPRAPGAAAALMKPRSPATMQHMMRSHFRPMSGGGSCQFVEIPEHELKRLQMTIEELKGVDAVDSAVMSSFFRLASFRGVVPLELSALDSLRYSAKVYIVPSSMGALKTVCLHVVAAGTIASTFTPEKIKEAYTSYILEKHPWIAIIFKLKKEAVEGK